MTLLPNYGDILNSLTSKNNVGEGENGNGKVQMQIKYNQLSSGPQMNVKYDLS